jgi:hypothetical protein
MKNKNKIDEQPENDIQYKKCCIVLLGDYNTSYNKLQAISPETAKKKLAIKRGDISSTIARLRMAYSLNKLVFKPEYSPEVAETYLQLLKMNLYWFAYESFSKKLTKIGINNYLRLSNQYPEIDIHITDAKKELNSLKNDFDNIKDYITFLSSVASPSLKTQLDTLNLKMVNEFNLAEQMTFIYAIRNNFVHNGDAAGTELSYNIKNKLFPILIKLLENILFKVGIKIMESEIIKVNNLLKKEETKQLKIAK